MITFNFPKSFWVISKQIGNARSVVNKELTLKNPQYDRGEKNEYVDTIGILGELIVMEYLTQKNKKFTMAKLLDYQPSKNADFVVNEKRIDVKTSKQSEYNTLLVNEDGHKKGLGKIDLYLFVYLLNEETCKFFFVNYEEVNNWSCKLMKYTNAYYCKIENLLEYEKKENE